MGAKKILGRGKSIASGTWHEGVLESVVKVMPTRDGCYNDYEPIDMINGVPLDRSTVGIHTMHHDHFGHPIYEHDIITFWIPDNMEASGGYEHAMYIKLSISKGWVVWGAKMTDEEATPLTIALATWEHFRVVGNLIDNSELLTL